MTSVTLRSAAAAPSHRTRPNTDVCLRQRVLESLWPGVQLYYPPVKFVPKSGAYETEAAAAARLARTLDTTRAHTLLFDLEDGCAKKEESRQLLRREVGRLETCKLQTALRINPFLSEEYARDLALLHDIGHTIDAVMLSKAGERYGAAEVRDLSDTLTTINPRATVQPIVEHPRSLKLAQSMMQFDSVKHLVFGVHDFSKAMAIQITPENWFEELMPYLHGLLLEARLSGCGIIGGVDTVLNERPLPDDLVELEDAQRWLASHGESSAEIVLRHACREMMLGLTGKQVIHPNHINLCCVAFVPSPAQVSRSIRVLRAATDATALHGGAISFEGEMLDPPMFGKAVQLLVRASALRSLPEAAREFLENVLYELPDRALQDNWPHVAFD